MIEFWVYLEARRFADRLDLGLGKPKGVDWKDCPLLNKTGKKSIWGEDWEFSSEYVWFQMPFDIHLEVLSKAVRYYNIEGRR